jgi:hypothetical protein
MYETCDIPGELSTIWINTDCKFKLTDFINTVIRIFF